MLKERFRGGDFRVVLRELLEVAPPFDLGQQELHLADDMYDEWIESFRLCPILTIPADQLDYVHKDGHLDIVTSIILRRLEGKEVVTFD